MSTPYPHLQKGFCWLRSKTSTWGDYLGLSKWAQSNYTVLQSRELFLFIAAENQRDGSVTGTQCVPTEASKMEKGDQKLKNMGVLEKLKMALTWELVRKCKTQSYKIGKELNSANNLNEKTDEESRSSLRAFREEYGLQYLDLSLVNLSLCCSSDHCFALFRSLNFGNWLCSNEKRIWCHNNFSFSEFI